MSKHTIKVVHIDDEALKVFVNGELIISANHDEDGWRGMEKIETTVRSMADLLGVELEEEHV